MMCFALLASNSHLSADNLHLPGQRNTDGIDAGVNMSKDVLLVTQNLLQQFGGKPAAVERGMIIAPPRRYLCLRLRRYGCALRVQCSTRWIRVISRRAFEAYLEVEYHKAWVGNFRTLFVSFGH
jgi:hypothetical protein